MAVRQLPPSVVNRIAAGEVIERPASVGQGTCRERHRRRCAGRIEVVTAGGGLSLIRVTDDGCGMDADDLALAVERHATSKLADDDLLQYRDAGLPRRGAAVHRLGGEA